jgi:iron complex transport system permease protein
VSRAAAADVAPRTTGRRPAGPLLVVAALMAVALAACASLMLGARTIGPGEVLAALLRFDGSPQHVAVAEVRLPRTVVAIAVGAALGMAGALMQALGRNELADPFLLGISMGAALAAVGGQVVLGVASAAMLAALAMAGAAVACAAVVALGLLGRGGLAAERLVVAGAAISAMLAALVQGLLVVDRESLEVARHWLAGSLTGAGWDGLVATLPYLGVGLLAAAVVARPLTTLGLGEDVASALGVRPRPVQALTAVAIVALAGASVALAGPVALVGLAVPHAARALVGRAIGPQLVACAVLGAVLVVVADILARVLLAPEELPVGVVTAVVGAPVLLGVARRRTGRG